MSGRALCAAFYRDVVAPLLDGVTHSAGLLGPGSEVLGFDDATSTDHAFGPRVLVFVDDPDPAAVERAVDAQLPDTYDGWSTTQRSFREVGDLYQRLSVIDPATWTTAYLGFDATREPTVVDWATAPSQLLATVVDGTVFHDGLDVLRPMQVRLRWYPDDVWRYVLAAQWRRISQEEHFVGRTAQRGDDLGSRLLTGRLVRDLMRLAFLIERRHAPYVKWFGTAFRRLPLAAQLTPPLEAALAADTYADREAALVGAYEIVMHATNALGLAPRVDPTVRAFYTRGFLVPDGNRFSHALYGAITDPRVLALRRHLGAVDQWVDSTDVLSYDDAVKELRRALSSP